MAYVAGTGFGEVYGAVTVYFNDRAGNILFCTAATGDIPSASAGYAVGCLLIDSTTGTHYYNSGSITSCTFSAV